MYACTVVFVWAYEYIVTTHEGQKVHQHQEYCKKLRAIYVGKTKVRSPHTPALVGGCRKPALTHLLWPPPGQDRSERLCFLSKARRGFWISWWRCIYLFIGRECPSCWCSHYDCQSVWTTQRSASPLASYKVNVQLQICLAFVSIFNKNGTVYQSSPLLYQTFQQCAILTVQLISIRPSILIKLIKPLFFLTSSSASFSLACRRSWLIVWIMCSCRWAVAAIFWLLSCKAQISLR